MKFLGGLFLFILSIVSYVFVLGEYYQWFLIPLGAPTVGLLNLYGISILLAFVTKPLNTVENPRTFAEGVWFRLTANLSVYLVGLLISSFM